MKCIKVITDEDFGLNPIPFDNPRERFGARGIIVGKDGKIAILYKSKKNEYKLIGGGIEKNELPISAFKRESLEETGCVIEIDSYLGIIKELKSQDNFKQTSYIYLAHILSHDDNQYFTEQEINDGSKLLWCSIDEAMNLIKDCESKLLPSKNEGDMSVYHTRFVVRRDYQILKYYKESYLAK